MQPIFGHYNNDFGEIPSENTLFVAAHVRNVLVTGRRWLRPEFSGEAYPFRFYTPYPPAARRTYWPAYSAPKCTKRGEWAKVVKQANVSLD